MNPWLLLVIGALLLRLGVSVLADLLNIRHAKDAPPDALRDLYDADTYAKSQLYLRTNTRVGLLQDVLETAILLAFIVLGGFGAVDRWAQTFGWGPVGTGLLFTAVLMIASRLLSLPFELYDTFVIEQKFGFNRTSARTFVLDQVKGLVLMALLGGPLLAAIIALFETTGPSGWLWVWATITAFQLVLVVLAPAVIMPLFNKFSPLAEGPLRTAIETYARDQRFAMRGLYTMDGSRRSSKTNAFFTGFGRARRIVLFDTLIARHTVPELVAVLAHEMGHYKLHHIPMQIVRSVLLTGFTLWLLSCVLGNAGLAAAFGISPPSTYTSLVCFGILYAPISLAVSILEHAISRRHEYAADAFAARTTGSAAPLMDALKKLSQDNLSNLSPHPFKVLVSYSHPPLLQRLRAMNALD